MNAYLLVAAVGVIDLWLAMPIIIAQQLHPWTAVAVAGASSVASEAFVEEGRLRESVRINHEGADGYDNLVVMSLLDREYQARVALGLEVQLAG